MNSIKMFSKRSSWKSDPNRLMAQLERLRSDGMEIIHLIETNPTRCGLIYDTEGICRAVSKNNILQYRPNPKGDPECRRAVQSYYETFGKHVSADQMFLTSSTSEAYSFLFKLLCDPGDQILVPKPSYPLFDVLATLDDVTLASYPLVYCQKDAEWRIDLEALYDAIGHRCKGIVIVSPNNPTGSYVKAEEIERIEAYCERFGLCLIIDEVFLDFDAVDCDPSSSMTCVGRSRVPTFVLSGLSKICALPQMKLGWIVTSGPDGLMQEMNDRLEWISDAYLSVSASAQAAAPWLLSERGGIQDQLKARIERNHRALSQSGLTDSKAFLYGREGGWYALLGVHSSTSDEAICCRLLEEQHVMVHPGYFYDIEAPDPVLVISLICAADQFDEGIQRMLRCLRSG
ncbi:pyridoxal phosphate-dependent aminotransferase [Desulfatirhabdium butyrativorans]|uniref:pyridoxal phosphate-dependent aminotransferase n=1 Tax=Desulfatirhabdium butyrativorans TaxID=340467 RepID=UPI00041561D8|nr:pyridoxal phosphate-dependent aminotransferase [Desulfatirhabdium butyrativorans]